MIIHQLFGFLGDKIMPKMFQDNQCKIKQFCDNNNYEYRLWSPDDEDDLFKGYEKYKPLYDSVRFSIMKVDIIRFIVLHKYGGVYLDLDIEPVIDKLKPYTFASNIKMIKNRKLYEIEILQSCKDNPILLQYLDYVITQVQEKDNIDVYKDWKWRYIMHTTGPCCFTRFIKKNKISVEEYKTNHCFVDVKKKLYEFNIVGDEDFISHPSVSWLKDIL